VHLDSPTASPFNIGKILKEDRAVKTTSSQAVDEFTAIHDEVETDDQKRANKALLESLKASQAYQQAQAELKSPELLDALQEIHRVFKPQNERFEVTDPSVPFVPDWLAKRVFYPKTEWISEPRPFGMEFKEDFSSEQGLSIYCYLYLGESLEIEVSEEGLDFIDNQLCIIFRIADPEGPLAHLLERFGDDESDEYEETPFDDLSSLLKFLAKAISDYEIKMRPQ
jgi:hypothetical protein